MNLSFVSLRNRPRFPRSILGALAISGLSLGNDGSDNLSISFDSDTQIGGSASDLAVSVDGPNTTDVYSFDRSDFSESGTGPYTYTLSTTQAYGDGDGNYTTTVDSATDTSGNTIDTGSQSDTYSLDTTAPTLSSTTLSNDGSDNLAFSFDTDEALSSASGDLGVSVDGPNTGNVYVFNRDHFSENNNGDGTYTYTLAVDQAYNDGEGSYTATVDVAKDPSGNDGGGSASDSYMFDTSAPTISSVSLADDGSGNLAFSFDSDEQLGSNSSDIGVSVDGPNTTDVYTFNRTDFSESGSGPYTYTLSTTQAYNDGDGTYTATVDSAVDKAGKDGASGENDSFLYDANAPTLSNTSLTNDGSDNLDFSFDTDEQLGGSTSDLQVTVDGPNTVDVYSFNKGDFSETDNGGSYTYNLTTTQAYDDGDGTYTATVDVAKDEKGNDGGGSASDSYVEEAPDPVTDLTSTAGDQQVTLDWTADDTVENDLQRYEVHRSTTSGFNPSAGDSTLVEDVTNFTEGNSVSYTDDGSGNLSTPTNGTTYYYEVIAVDSDGFTADSNETSSTPSSSGSSTATSTSIDDTGTLSWSTTTSDPATSISMDDTGTISWS